MYTLGCAKQLEALCGVLFWFLACVCVCRCMFVYLKIWCKLLLSSFTSCWKIRTSERGWRITCFFGGEAVAGAGQALTLQDCSQFAVFWGSSLRSVLCREQCFLWLWTIHQNKGTRLVVLGLGYSDIYGNRNWLWMESMPNRGLLTFSVRGHTVNI